MPTPEELAAQEAAQKEAAAKAEAPKGPVVLQGEHIPEAFRGKTDKEIVELLLNTSTELERQKGMLSAREQEIEQLKPKPALEQMTEADKKAAKEKQFINDPLAYLDQHYNERMKPLTEEYYKGRADIALTLAKGDKENYPDFATLEKPIKGYLDQMPMEVRANPMAIDWAYKMAEYPELKKRIKEGTSREGLHVQGAGSPPPPQQAAKRVLDDEEKVVAARFGLSEEDYIKFSGAKSIDDIK